MDGNKKIRATLQSSTAILAVKCMSCNKQCNFAYTWCRQSPVAFWVNGRNELLCPECVKPKAKDLWDICRGSLDITQNRVRMYYVSSGDSQMFSYSWKKYFPDKKPPVTDLHTLKEPSGTYSIFERYSSNKLSHHTQKIDKIACWKTVHRVSYYVKSKRHEISLVTNSFKFQLKDSDDVYMLTTDIRFNGSIFNPEPNIKIFVLENSFTCNGIWSKPMILCHEKIKLGCFMKRIEEKDIDDLPDHHKVQVALCYLPEYSFSV